MCKNIKIMIIRMVIMMKIYNNDNKTKFIHGITQPVAVRSSNVSA